MAEVDDDSEEVDAGAASRRGAAGSRRMSQSSRMRALEIGQSLFRLAQQKNGREMEMRVEGVREGRHQPLANLHSLAIALRGGQPPDHIHVALKIGIAHAALPIDRCARKSADRALSIAALPFRVPPRSAISRSETGDVPWPTA